MSCPSTSLCITQAWVTRSGLRMDGRDLNFMPFDEAVRPGLQLSTGRLR
jgi:hypothetical protein